MFYVQISRMGSDEINAVTVFHQTYADRETGSFNHSDTLRTLKNSKSNVRQGNHEIPQLWAVRKGLSADCTDRDVSVEVVD